MIEAAVVLPIVIITVLTVVLVLARCYERSEARSTMHKDLYGSDRTEASVVIGDETIRSSHHVSNGVRYVLKVQKAKELISDDQ